MPGVSNRHNGYDSSSKHDAAGIIPGHNITAAGHAHGAAAGSPGETKFNSHSFKENDGFRDTHREKPNPQNGSRFKFEDHKEDSSREGKDNDVHSWHPDGERVDANGHFVKESHNGVDVKDINGATDTVHKNTSGTEFRGMFQKHHAGPDNSDAHDSKLTHSGALDSQHQKEEHKDPTLHTMHETSSGKGTWSFNMVGNGALRDFAQESKNWPKQGEMSQTGKPSWGNSLPKSEGEMGEASKVDWGSTHPKRSDEMFANKHKSGQPQIAQQDVRSQSFKQPPSDNVLVKKRTSEPKQSDDPSEMAQQADIEFENMYSHPAPDEMLAELQKAKPHQFGSASEMAASYAASAPNQSENLKATHADVRLDNKTPYKTPVEMATGKDIDAKHPPPDIGGPIHLPKRSDQMMANEHDFKPKQAPDAGEKPLGEKKMCRYKGTKRYNECLSSEWNNGKIGNQIPPLEKSEDAALHAALGADTGDSVAMHLQARNSGEEDVIELPPHPYMVGHAGARIRDPDDPLPPGYPIQLKTPAYDRGLNPEQKLLSRDTADDDTDLNYKSIHHLVQADYLDHQAARTTPHKILDKYLGIHHYRDNGGLSSVDICSIIFMSASLLGFLFFLGWLVPRKIMARRSRKRAAAAEAQRDVELADFNAELDQEIVDAAATRREPK